MESQNSNNDSNWITRVKFKIWNFSLIMFYATSVIWIEQFEREEMKTVAFAIHYQESLCQINEFKKVGMEYELSRLDLLLKFMAVSQKYFQSYENSH